MWKKLISSAILSFSLCAGYAQTQIDSVSSTSINNEFILKVKSIDDFIDRFNGVDSGYLKEHLLKLDSNYQTDRKTLLLSIIDETYKQDNDVLCKEFIELFTDSSSNSKLDFFKSNIYAQITGDYKLNGTKITLDHILKIKTNGLGGKKAQWVISYVPFSQLYAAKEDNISSYLPPTNHNSKFNKLRDFINPAAIHEIVDLENDNGLATYLSLMSIGELELVQLDNSDLKYFIYIDNWLIEVTEYKREGMQSGYLIDGLQKVLTPNPKEQGLMNLILPMR